ncbi:carboxypeptidase T [Sphaerisporangium rufum]|uniref:Zinc carboxypeptidase n=1 Tax=Sphaerisporangium rufum TaxID=1381558 RepID=A0A919R3V4_9ACTN|nr:M14 family metallopeptidase [Sphaerisporangium rufum]GII79202.1 carboxypeptidase T [Sphaerisporangium rufum]
MGRRLLAALVTLVALCASLTPGAGATAEPPPARQYRVDGPDSARQRSLVARTGASIDEVRASSVVVTASRAEADRIAGLGYRLTALPGPRPPQRPRPQDFPGEDARYHNYPELSAAVDRLVAASPAIARRSRYGTTAQGRALIAVKISDNVAADENEPEVLFTAHQHAREHLTVEMALYLMNLLTTGYRSDPRITRLVDSREIWILPDLNPDGGEFDIATGAYRSWRKNRQATPGSPYIGTDLNRNWAYRWGCCRGSSASPPDETYRGAAAESTPEVRAVADFVRGRVVGGRQQIKAAIDFHTYSELVLWPYGYTYGDAAPGMSQDDADAFAALGRSMADANGYTPQQSSDLYITDGGIDDWLWGAHKIFGFTFEMYPRTFLPGFYPPDEQIVPQTSRNKEAVLRLLEYADCVYRIIGRQARYC